MNKSLFQAERKMRFLHKFFSISCLFIQFFIYAGNYPTLNISKKDGLISNDIKSVIKAKNDVVWMATENGVATYNGERISNYTMNKGLPHNNCWKLIEDENGVIWIATYGGGIAYYENEQFHTIDKSNGLKNNSCRAFYIKDNLLYVGSQKGLSVVEIATKKVVKQNFIFNEMQIMDFFEYKNEVYFVSYNHGVFKIENNNLKKVNNSRRIFCAFLDNNSLYLGYDGNSPSKNSIAKINISEFLKGSQDFKWFGKSVIWDFARTKEGLFAAAWGVNFESGGLFFQPKESSSPFDRSNFNVTSKNIMCLYLDQRTNILFAGSVDEGLYILDLNKPLLKVNNDSYIFKYQDEKNTIQSTHSILSNKLNRLKKSDFINYISIYKKAKKNNNLLSLTKDLRNYFINKIDFEDIFEIIDCQYIDSYIFANTSHGLFKIKTSQGVLKFEDYYAISGLSFYVENLETIYFQKPYSSYVKLKIMNDGNLDIYRYDLKNKNNPRDGIKNLKLGKSLFVFSRFSGVYKYDDTSFVSLSENNHFNEKEILEVVKVNEKEALIVNHQGSIFLLKNTPTETTFKLLTTSNFLIGDVVYAVQLKDSLLFAATNIGLNVFDLRTNKRFFLDEEHGIPSKEIERLSIQENSLSIHTQSGIFELDIAFILNEHDCGDIFLYSAYTKNEKLTLNQYGEVFLKSEQDQLEITLASNGVKYPKKLLYRFLLRGNFNSKWSKWKQFSSNKLISFPYLPAGESEIILQTNNLFTGSKHEFILTKINKKKLFYNEIWFILLLMSIVSFLIYRAIKRRYKSLYKRQKEKALLETRLEEAKLEALTSQMSPHFIFNSLNAIQSFILQNNTEKSIEYINDFSSLVRNTLNYSSKKHINLKEEIKYLTLYVKIQNLRFGNKIHFNLSVNESIDLFETEIPPLLLQPLIENSFEHAFDDSIVDPKINLYISETSDYLVISVKDNGVGFKLENSENSKGLKLIRERILILNSNNSIDINTGEEGTEARLLLCS